MRIRSTCAQVLAASELFVRCCCANAAAPIKPPIPIDSTALLGTSIKAPFSFSPSYSMFNDRDNIDPDLRAHEQHFVLRSVLAALPIGFILQLQLELSDKFLAREAAGRRVFEHAGREVAKGLPVDALVKHRLG